MQMDWLAARYPLLWRYAFLIRFVVLILIWGTAAFDYKVFMDLSVRGIVLSALFFTGSILVFLGYKTRVSMLVLGATLLVHGVLFYHRSSLAGGILAFASLPLPLGAFYSIDRLLAVGNRPVPYSPSGEAIANPLRTPWKIVFVALLVFNIGGPAYNQIFHHDSKLFLSWHMFHTIGRDLVIVHFSTAEGTSQDSVDYMKTLGHRVDTPGVHRNNRIASDLRIVGMDQLNDVILRLCKRVGNPAALRLDARMTTLKRGWRQLYDGKTPICDAAGKPILKSFPVIDDEINLADDDDS